MILPAFVEARVLSLKTLRLLKCCPLTAPSQYRNCHRSVHLRKTQALLNRHKNCIGFLACISPRKLIVSCSIKFSPLAEKYISNCHLKAKF